jgi:hypothetical protein
VPTRRHHREIIPLSIGTATVRPSVIIFCAANSSVTQLSAIQAGMYWKYHHQTLSWDFI